MGVVVGLEVWRLEVGGGWKVAILGCGRHPCDMWFPRHSVPGKVSFLSSGRIEARRREVRGGGQGTRGPDPCARLGTYHGE
jgi:hypothetical protein